MTRFRAAWVLPIDAPVIRDGWLGVENGRITAIGGDASPDAVDLGRVALLPGLVNAHIHLELSYLHGQIPRGATFIEWVQALLRARREQPVTDAQIVASAAATVTSARASGTALIGDVANTPVTIEVLQQVLRPFVLLLNGVSTLVLRVTGLDRPQAARERYHDPEELQIIIQESQEGGQLRHDAGELLRELFEFGNLTASEVMVPRVQMTSVRVGADADELRRIVRARLHTRYPVHTGNPDDILGSLHIKDIIRHLVSGEPISMLDVRPVPYVPVTAQLDEVLTAMRRSRSHMAVALDEHGGTAGIVTIEDLFQEVVGTIGDTGDVTPPVPGEGGAWTARGTTRLRDVGEALGITFEYPDVQSVSGLVLALLGRPPVRGDAVVWAGIRIEVTAVDGRGVQEAALSRL